MVNGNSRNSRDGEEGSTGCRIREDRWVVVLSVRFFASQRSIAVPPPLRSLWLFPTASACVFQILMNVRSSCSLGIIFFQEYRSQKSVTREPMQLEQATT
jgi:hypothetical protein